VGFHGTSISAWWSCASCIPCGRVPPLWDSWQPAFITVNCSESAKIAVLGAARCRTLRKKGRVRPLTSEGSPFRWPWGWCGDSGWQWDSYCSCAICCTRGEASAKKQHFGLEVTENNCQPVPNPFSFPSLGAGCAGIAAHLLPFFHRLPWTKKTLDATW